MRRLSLLALLLLSCPALAATPRPDLVDPRALGLGGALRTLAGPTEAPRLNPAGLGLERGFFLGSSYATRRTDSFDALSVTVVDNVTSPMGGAIQYLRLQGDEEREDLSLSLSAGKRGLWWGFTARYVHGREPDNAEWEDGGTADVGFLFERPSGTRIAVVGYDLLGTPLDFLERRVALGLSQAGIAGWTLAADVVRGLERDVSRGVDLHLGAEYAVRKTAWALRLGQMWNGQTGKDYASMGFGWSRAGMKVGYALQKARQRSSEYLHAFGVEGTF